MYAARVPPRCCEAIILYSPCAVCVCTKGVLRIYIHVIICRYYAMDQFSPAPLVNNRAKQTARATTVYRVAIINYNVKSIRQSFCTIYTRRMLLFSLFFETLRRRIFRRRSFGNLNTTCTMTAPGCIRTGVCTRGREEKNSSDNGWE